MKKKFAALMVATALLLGVVAMAKGFASVKSMDLTGEIGPIFPRPEVIVYQS